MKPNMKPKLFFLFLLLLALSLQGLGCKGGSTEAQALLKEPVVLKYWRIFDGPDAFETIIRNYKKLYPNVDIQYKKLRFEEFESELLDALAEDRGPDLFSIHNTWISKYQSKILPMPKTVRLPIVIEEGILKKEKKASVKNFSTLTPDRMKNVFIDVVNTDVIRDQSILGLPLSVDTLALFYNRDIFDQAGIPEPPRSWAEVKDASIRMTGQGADGSILRAGIALGGYGNINRVFDIMSLLMMQNGTEMTQTGSSSAAFSRIPEYIRDKNYHPGQEAVRFYSDFANPQKEVYTWNETFPESEEAFMQGKVGMMLGYSYQLATIRALAPKMNLALAPVPHITTGRLDSTGKEINYANYWVETVSTKSNHPDHAWNFLLFASNAEQVTSYLLATQKPTALRALIKDQLNDPVIGIFASQLLTSQSWYRGRRPDIATQAFKNLVKEVLVNSRVLKDGLKIAEQTINQTIGE